MNSYTNTTKIYNYMIDDTLSDILNKEFPQPKNRFQQFLRERGCSFEEFILQELKTKSRMSIPTVSNHISEKSLQKAEKMMKQGHKILHSVPLICHSKKVKGIVDFLVRSDSLHLFFNNVSIPRELRRKKSKFSNMYHYIPIDVKYKSVYIDSESNLRPRKEYNYISGQVYLYAKCLEEMQNCFPTVCYILGRHYKSNDQVYQPLETLAKLDYRHQFTTIPQLVDQALSWIDKCMTEEWKELIEKRQVTCKEMLPNTKSENLTWKKYKIDFARDLNVISQFWHCVQKHNQALFDKGMIDCINVNMNDLNLSQHRKEIVEKMLYSTSLDIPENLFPQLPNEFFVDFEIIPRIWFDNFKSESNELLFMIGIGWFEGDDWKFKLCISDQLNRKCELKIMQGLIDFLPPNSNVYHWGHIEQSMWSRKMKEHSIKTDNNITWINMQHEFQKNQIVLPGFKSFKLKHVGKIFQDNGFFRLQYDEDLDNGLDCVMDSIEYYNTGDEQLGNRLKSYNEMDCQLLGYILKSCRKK